MAATKSNKSSQEVGRARLYRFALGLWSAVAAVAIFAPWPYTMAAVLLATFMHFSALDESPRD